MLRIYSILFSLLFLLSAGLVLAQTSSDYAILSWHANTFYPTDFIGKPLAVNQSNVKLRVEVISDGKILDLSNADIAWYLDGSLFDSGVGMKEINFFTTKRKGQRHLVRNKISMDGAVYESSASILISDPEVVIESPFPDNKIGSGEQAKFTIVPYFFNANLFSDLNFSWKINGKEALGETDNVLTVNVGNPVVESQKTLTVEGMVENIQNIFESVQSKVQLYIR